MMEDAVLVTGGTGLIGRAIVSALLRENRAVVLTSRSEKKPFTFWGVSGTPELLQIQVDLTTDDAPAKVMETLRANGVRVTQLVHTARSLNSLATNPDGSSAPDQLRAEFELQVVLPYRLVLSIDQAEEHALESVVLLGSQYGLVGPNSNLYERDLSKSPIQYGVSKAALHHLAKELAVRLAPSVRVNAIAFGGFQGRATQEFVDQYSSMNPSGRMLRAEEAAGPVLFLLSDASSSVTGSILVADGGWTVW